MTRLVNDPRSFTSEMIDGFVAANPGRVRAVDGGVVRATHLDEGKVAVVVGGGSGHYPAFAGLVGPGLAAGAAMGNVFASPAAAQVESVARAVERGGGILLTYGNYAGDVLNFDAAQHALRSDGLPCETVVVTDDVSSAPPDESHLRRGVAGDLVVFKCAGAAAEAGDALADVVRVARLANSRMRTLGAAFTGCTLPGADAPLFTIPDGHMALGMGIHGEPGLAEVGLPSADQLAALLVERLLDEIPADVGVGAGTPVVPILNGLGSVKYEELFVLYRSVAQLLHAAGSTIVDPHVGEYCTSLDMAGVSLTLFWPDDELTRLWLAPADTPAYRRGSSASVPDPARVPAPTSTVTPTPTPIPPGSVESQHLARHVVAALAAAAAAVHREVDELGRLDAVAGDGDHGIGMLRGVDAALAAARSAADARAGAGTVLARAGDAWVRDAGGTSGALWGGALRAMGEALGDGEVPAPGSIADVVAAAAEHIQARGGARVGDKTMIDALDPFRRVLASELASGAAVADAVARAAGAADAAATATADLIPRVGRARPHAARSLGTPDPGARSLAVIVSAIADAIPAIERSGR